jgi:hypothetical protein
MALGKEKEVAGRRQQVGRHAVSGITPEGRKASEQVLHLFFILLGFQ